MSQADQHRDVVITGLGVVSPIGIGPKAFWSSLQAGRSGVRPITQFDTSALPVQFGAEVVDFDPKAYVRPRKSLKLMSREIQFGFAAADMAVTSAGLTSPFAEPDRCGVVFAADMIYCELAELENAYRRCLAQGEFDFADWAPAAMTDVYPLFLLRNLPNMIACHVAIVHDARGPCNTIGHSDVGSLAALAEAVRAIERDSADVMLAGGVGCRIHPTAMAYRGDGDLSHRSDDPASASRPFDAQRDGLVNGEGAAAFVLESRQHAQRRGAPILAQVLSYASAHEPLRGNQAVYAEPLTGSAIRQVIAEALRRAHLQPGEIGHVNAHGLSTMEDDRCEAQAIHALLGDVPVTAPKSFFGHLGSGGGALELAASVVGLQAGEIPITLNYQHPDPACPVNVIHGSALRTNRGTASLHVFSGESSLGAASNTVLKLSTSRLGHAAAMIIAAG
ncbi:MAG TPA: beta-ketoacyl-[acyl-carrier-protein] synthase family protein [Pirellulales bacterium]|jgi:3-oxoacyl-[acyl-carrier-protein] synthase II|nr:beta-ketoacyl-[acyl-carrier-protein] synthase family protein [Pirellulales bacterium]